MKKIFGNSSLHSIPIIYALQKEFKQKRDSGAIVKTVKKLTAWKNLMLHHQ